MESNNPLVSVVVTTKNEEFHIKSCLQSISSQSYKNIEIIVVDNNSKDRTRDISKTFTALVFDKGPERSAQRNFGAKKAKGKYLIFIDADMILNKDVIQECVETAKRPEIGGVVIPEKSIGIGFFAKVKAFERSLYEGDESIEAARFFKKNVFIEAHGYDENITGPEDWDLPQRIKVKHSIGRIKSYILHDEGKVSLFKLIKKKYYYGLKVRNYLESNHSAGLTSKQMIYLLRPAFYKNWRKLISNPVISLGMIFMLSLEQVSGLLGFLKGAILNSRISVE